ncbi:MAG: ABC transporter ATP-binding protein [Polyangiaceae bacterium]|nr:ABC transporter ATP-binding protein [Polyangiaceae bacterium]
MIEVKHLSKSYGAFQAVKDISFRVDAGEVVGFLGPNGAGKSTTLRILAGFLGPTTGDVRVAGYSITDEPLKARENIGYMPETSPLYPEMRTDEYLRYRAELKGVKKPEREPAVERAMSDAGLGGMERVLIGQLSKGYRQRVGLADALVASPKLLILDEPTAGLDPNQIREVRDLIARLSEKHTIFVSTHILSEVEAMCSRGIVIARGSLVAEGTIEELRATRRADGVRIRVRHGAAKALKALAGVAGIDSTTDDDDAHVLIDFDEDVDPEETIERAVAALAAASAGVTEVVPRSSLEEVFAQLTRKEPS